MNTSNLLQIIDETRSNPGRLGRRSRLVFLPFGSVSALSFGSSGARTPEISLWEQLDRFMGGLSTFCHILHDFPHSASPAFTPQTRLAASTPAKQRTSPNTRTTLPQVFGQATAGRRWSISSAWSPTSSLGAGWSTRSVLSVGFVFLDQGGWLLFGSLGSVKQVQEGFGGPRRRIPTIGIQELEQ